MRNILAVCIIGLLICDGWFKPAQAQISTPQLPIASLNKSAVSASEAAHHVKLKEAQLENAISFRQLKYPKDSMLKAVSMTAREWFAELQSQSVKGMQLDPMGYVGAEAKDEESARSRISERLNTPGLSYGDRAFTYLNAVRSFANWHYPERLSFAELYLAELEAMGELAAPWAYEAHRTLLDVYYMLGQTTKVVHHGERMAKLLGVMPMYDRGVFYSPSGSEVYTKIIEALSGSFDGQKRIKKLNDQLSANTMTVSSDSQDIWNGRGYAATLRNFQLSTALLGAKAKPLVAQYWLNRSSKDSASILLDDGRIRLVEISSYGCAACLMELHGLQRLKQQFPDVEVLMITSTVGSWANRLIDADEEADRIADHFLNKLNITFPIGIWKTKKAINEDGGVTPIDYGGPNLKNYPSSAVPTTYAIDSKGIVRRIFIGYSRDAELQMERTIQFLRQERVAQ